jgi:hypothetical protein
VPHDKYDYALTQARRELRELQWPDSQLVMEDR